LIILDDFQKTENTIELWNRVGSELVWVVFDLYSLVIYIAMFKRFKEVAPTEPTVPSVEEGNSHI
jgi:hypothetical protein